MNEVSKNKALSALAAEHEIGLQFVRNARDLGGYHTSDGHRVKRGLLLRTAKLDRASAEDINIFLKHNLTEIVDLRAEVEIEKHPDPYIPGVKRTVLGFLDDSGNDEDTRNVFEIYARQQNMAEAFIEITRRGLFGGADTYAYVLDSNHAITETRHFFDLLLSHGDGAFLWHCVSGKDRTGILAVMILTVLGVEKKTALDDYELTNIFLADKIDQLYNMALAFTDDERDLLGVKNITGVSRILMEILFEQAEIRYGSLLNFLKTEVRLTDSEMAVLRAKYLE